MEHLWAPWRNIYVAEGARKSENLFVELGQSANDAENFIVDRSRHCYAALNRFPYNASHLLVAPYRKVPDLEQLSNDETHDLIVMVKRMKRAISTAFKPHGFNIGINIGVASGAGIPEHLHIHVVPRWDGDANFMTSVANARVHPNDLPSIYRKLRDTLGKIEAPDSLIGD
jgi:ATP adenylyltransferase